ncbi:hypothetical protein YB2330_005647 [Saitoella coloradoensis]
MATPTSDLATTATDLAEATSAISAAEATASALSSTLDKIKYAWSSPDHCVHENWCRIPAIIIIVIGISVLISLICCIRGLIACCCCCCPSCCDGRGSSRGRSRTQSFGTPYTQPQPINVYTQPAPVQSPRADYLPSMPASWSGYNKVDTNPNAHADIGGRHEENKGYYEMNAVRATSPGQPPSYNSRSNSYNPAYGAPEAYGEAPHRGGYGGQEAYSNNYGRHAVV